MIEQRPVIPTGVDKLKELSDIDLSTLYDIQKEFPDEIFILVNNIGYKNALTFKFVPFSSLVNKFLGNGNIINTKNKDELEIKSELDTLMSKINGIKGRQKKEIDSLKTELENIKKLLPLK